MKTFPPQVALDIDQTGYLYVRAGKEHRFIAVWTVLVGERVMIRSWYGKKTGWFPAFVKEKTGAIKLKKDAVEIPVRGKHVRSEKLLDAMDVAYSEKYTSKASRKYVKGFATAKRRAMTLELTPA